MARSDERVEAVLFDLDDTLFAQAGWLEGAWSAVVAEAVASHGVDPGDFAPRLRSVAAEGSARGGIIDRALAAIGRADVEVAPLVAAFHAHVPTRLDPFPGVVSMLAYLARRVPLGLVTDGAVPAQRSKLAALGLTEHFSVVVFSDHLGRENRKPSALPFRCALQQMCAEPGQTVFVGDNPIKDVLGATRVGMRAVRVHTGEYATEPDVVRPWRRADQAADLVSLLEPMLAERVQL